MSPWALMALGVVAVVMVWAGCVGLLVWRGRSADAVALARFIPDCVVLFRRLLGDRRLSRPRKLLVWALLGYLISPIDLVPDFIPIAGQLDDAVIAGLILRIVLRGAGSQIVREHWPGPARSLAVVLRWA